jgi:hypothetical protein
MKGELCYLDLTAAYREYVNYKSMNQMICGVENRYAGITSAVHQFARSTLDFQGDPTIFTSHLSGMRHESVLAAIASSNPYQRSKVSPVDQVLNAVLPIATVGYALWSNKSKAAEHKKTLNQDLPESEINMYLNRVPDQQQEPNLINAET